MAQRVVVMLVVACLFTVGRPARPEGATSATVAADGQTSAGRAGSTQEEFLRLLADAQKAYTAVNDYVTTIVIQERIEGELRPIETGILKFKKPFAVYIKWHAGPQAGLQALYVRGQNGGKLLARKGGVLGLVTFRLEPTSKLALGDNRHPITEAGVGYILDMLESNSKRAAAAGQGRVRRLPELPEVQPRGPRYELLVEADANAGYYCHRCVVTFDLKTRLVAGVQVYDWNDQLIEDFRLFNVRLNVGLTENDFSPDNPQYNF